MSSVFTAAVLQGLNAVGSLAEAASKYSGSYSCALIAKDVGASELFMQRLLYKLSQADIVTVKRGPGGGFKVTDHQLKVRTVKDVLEALGQHVVAPEGSRASDRLQQTVHDVLDVTLADFFGAPKERKECYHEYCETCASG